MRLPQFHYSSFSSPCPLLLLRDTGWFLFPSFVFHRDSFAAAQFRPKCFLSLCTSSPRYGLKEVIWCHAKTLLFPSSLQSTSGSAQASLLPQGVRLLRSPAVPQASSDAFTFPQTACPLEQNFTVEEVNTPKVGPICLKVNQCVRHTANKMTLCDSRGSCLAHCGV